MLVREYDAEHSVRSGLKLKAVHPFLDEGEGEGEGEGEALTVEAQQQASLGRS